MKKLCSLLMGILLLAACGSKGKFSPDEEDMQQAKQVTIFESKDSQKKWILKADTVDFEDMAHAILYNPQLLLREDGQDAVEVTGKRGVLNYNKKLVAIDGNAKIQSFTQKAVLTTDRFFYNFGKDRIWSDRKTVVTRGTAKMTAKGGIETDSKLRKIEFKKQTTRLPTDPQELQGVSL